MRSVLKRRKTLSKTERGSAAERPQRMALGLLCQEGHSETRVYLGDVDGEAC